MSYKVLARKRRPQTFEEVVGQTHITRTLANAIKLNRLGHAFLFSGSRGIGKTTTARILAKALNCEKGPTPQPCNACRHCTEITAGTSMDVIEIDGASNRGIDEIRELRENVRYSPVSARCKVIIIDEVHMLTREAFNALLKTLEEPPDHVIFVLATTEAHKVPVTILSRCQRYDFRRIDVATLKESLADICRLESITIEDRTLDVLAHMADGGMRDCLSLLDQVISFCGTEIDHDQTMRLLGRIDPEQLFDVFRGIASGNGASALERFAHYIESGGDETVFNREMMELTRDLMAIKLDAEPRSTLPADLADGFSIDQLERMFRIMLDLEQSFRLTEFPRLLMDVALVKMSRIRRLTPISEILDRLKKLESGFTAGAAPVSTPRVPAAGRQTGPQAGETAPQRPAPVRKSPPPEQKKPAPSAGEPPPPATPRPEKKTLHKPAGQPRKRALKTSPPPDGEKENAPDAAVVPGGSGADAPEHPKDRQIVDNTPLQKLIDALPENAAPMKGMLIFAAVESFSDRDLTLVFSPGQRMHHALLDSYENRAELFAEATRAAFGSERSVRYRLGTDAAPYSLRECELMDRRRLRDERLRMAQAHPAVEKALKMFRGRIREVRTKNGAASAPDGKNDVEDNTDDE